jgi:hypothetical protein
MGHRSQLQFNRIKVRTSGVLVLYLKLSFHPFSQLIGSPVHPFFTSPTIISHNLRPRHLVLQPNIGISIFTDWLLLIIKLIFLGPQPLPSE